MELINDKNQVACFQLGTLYEENGLPHSIEICFDNDFLRYNYIRKLEKQLKGSISNAINDVFVELKKNNITIDLATKGLTEVLRKISDEMFNVYSAISYSLDDYDFTSQELLELANVDFNLVMTPAYRRLEAFYSASNDIEQYYAEVDAYRKRVGGFGFGITGFVKSQIVAGAINMTADKLHDIFVTPANQNRMNRDIKELGLTLVNDINFREEIQNAFSDLIDRLNYAYFTYLSRKDLISNKSFYDYHYENDEKVSRYLDNSLSDSRNSILDIVDICTSSIEQSPYNPNLYFKLIAFLETYNMENCEKGEEEFNTDEVIKIMNYLGIYEDYRKIAEDSALGQKGLRLLKEPKDYEDVVDGCRVLSHVKFALKYDAIAGIMGYITRNQKQANQGRELVDYTSKYYEEISDIYLNELLKGVRFSGLNSNNYLQNFFYGEKFFDTIKSAELGNELAFTISTYMFVMPTICRYDNKALQKSLTELIDKCIDSIVMDNIYEKYLLSLKEFVVNKDYSKVGEQLDAICDDNVDEELSYESLSLINCIQGFTAYLNFIYALNNADDNNLVMAHFSSSVMDNSYFSYLARVSIADGIIAGEYGPNRIERQMISLGGQLPDRYEELVAIAEDLKRTMDIILSKGYSYRATGKVNKNKLTLKAFNLYSPDKSIIEDMLYLIEVNCQNAIQSSVGTGMDPYIYLMEEFVSENIVDIENLAKKRKFYVSQYTDESTLQQQAYQVTDQYLTDVLFVAKPYLSDRDGFVLCKDGVYFRHDSKKVQHAKLLELEKVIYIDTYNWVEIDRRYGSKLNVKMCNDHFFSETLADFINEIIAKVESGYLFVKSKKNTGNENKKINVNDCSIVQEKTKKEQEDACRKELLAKATSDIKKQVNDILEISISSNVPRYFKYNRLEGLKRNLSNGQFTDEETQEQREYIALKQKELLKYYNVLYDDSEELKKAEEEIATLRGIINSYSDIEAQLEKTNELKTYKFNYNSSVYMLEDLEKQLLNQIDTINNEFSVNNNKSSSIKEKSEKNINNRVTESTDKKSKAKELNMNSKDVTEKSDFNYNNSKTNQYSTNNRVTIKAVLIKIWKIIIGLISIAVFGIGLLGISAGNMLAGLSVSISGVILFGSRKIFEHTGKSILSIVLAVIVFFGGLILF